MAKRGWQTPNNFEAKPLPELNRPAVRAHHEIELHGAESAFLSAFKRVETHGSRNPPPFRRRRGDIAAIGHMRAAATLVGSQEIGTEDARIPLPHKRFVFGSEPKFERRFPAHIARQRVGFGASNHGLEDGPNGVFVSVSGEADRQDDLPYFSPINFSNSVSFRIGTSSSFALSYFEPGSVPTTT